MLYGSYAREDYVPGSDVDILFPVSSKEDDWNKVSKMAGNHFLDKNIRFSPKIIEKEVFDERRSQQASTVK